MIAATLALREHRKRREQREKRDELDGAADAIPDKPGNFGVFGRGGRATKPRAAAGRGRSGRRLIHRVIFDRESRELGLFPGEKPLKPGSDVGQGHLDRDGDWENSHQVRRKDYTLHNP